MKKWFYILVLVFHAASTIVLAKVSVNEKKVLLDFYESTNGANWTIKWDLSRSISNWHGVGVENGKIVSLNLFNNNLTGTLPGSIGKLRHLKVFNVAFNAIGGNIPENIVLLKKLRVLRLGKNHFKGSIPATIGNLENLEVLDMFGNALSGQLPKGLGKMKGIKWLFLSHNALNGTLPKELGNLESLERLELAGNKLEGHVPSSMASLHNLNTLILSENRLTGRIPQGIFSLPMLRQLQIQNNNFDKFQLIDLGRKKTDLALFDFDGKGHDYRRKDFKNIPFDSEIRTADTHFEDTNE